MKHVLFSFEGRINRAQYWLGVLCMLVQVIVCFGLLTITFDMQTNMPSAASYIILCIFFIFSTWQSLALYAKRFHDRNKSGWWILISFVPIIGGFWLLIETGFLPGTEGDNQFGRMPK
ncbi:DUF805 domain-containing protein [Vibrio sagamiensis]|uniref:DUF805 domain-containing protein n=1 Tax=Vibrio sagamiensis NBRC 104589 TaxID=1219064 RepID=A0A511QBJ4_9VIBR|nr:DUF805 domain-containing protein [Vibrio sagamiensis]PNQ70971.1 DUF805 domain-containing protein [Vibrio agarivorans]GEM74638.1 DUF805 domain-containing protein [Vibrio sagamiensis NBRC 104589]